MRKLENCLLDFKKIDNKVRNRYSLNISEFNYILEKAKNEDSKTELEFLLNVVLITYNIAFVLGRRSKK